MTPLNERDQRTHVQIARVRATMELAWDEVVRCDLEAAADLYEQTAEICRSIKFDKVRGKKGGGFKLVT